MASPTIESLCCLNNYNAFSKDFLTDFSSVPYNSVSLVFSLLGITGAIYQILPRTTSNIGAISRSGRFFKTRGRVIIKWLALADLMASIGILVRSATWLVDRCFGTDDSSNETGRVLCLVTSAWIHYFYTATYFWTLIYAIDVKFVMIDNKQINHRVYHLICWSCPALLCSMGLMILYLPDLDCHSHVVNPFVRFLPNYLSTFVPIIMVMICNPILYCSTFSKAEQLITSTRGRFTQSERNVVDKLRRKFLLINGVFYVCWLPNILNGIILWSVWNSLPRTFILTLWYLMAVLNPLQAVFNSMVYRSWDSSSTFSRPKWGKRRGPATCGDSSSIVPEDDSEVELMDPILRSLPPSNESTPLISSR